MFRASTSGQGWGGSLSTSHDRWGFKIVVVQTKAIKTHVIIFVLFFCAIL